MTELNFKELKPIQMSIEPQTRLLLLKQGDNTIKITRDSVIAMKKLRNGDYKEGVYTSSLTPRNRFQVSENGYISIQCKDDWESNVVIVANHKKLDDLQRICEFVDKNKAKIAWEREFRGRY